MGTPPTGGRDGGGGTAGGGDLRLPPPEHGRTVFATRPIMDLCLAAERRPGPKISKRWWEQDRLDVNGMRTAAREAERTEGEEEMDGTKTETD